MKEQIPLKLSFPEQLSFDNFLIGSNAEAVSVIQSLATAVGQSLFLWGGRGAGKSHLCQALYHELIAQNQHPFYVDASEPGILPEILEAAEDYSVVILDAIDSVLLQESWVEGIFHCYNRTIQNQHNLFITARQAPKAYQKILPDMQSRLSGSLVYQLHELSDDEKLKAMKLRAREYGFELSNEVGLYLLNHVPRGTHELFAILRKLDHANLAHKRRLTVPFVKQVLELSN